jgi:flavin-dependent dehydrogenase
MGLARPRVRDGLPSRDDCDVDLDDFPLTGRDLEVDGVPMGLGPRRAVLDQVLVEAAIEAGAEFREGFSVDDLVFDDGRVVGIEGRGDGGDVRERAKFVVGADGQNSRVAKRVEAPAYETVSGLTVWYFSYWSGVAREGLEILQRGRRIIFAFPTSDDLFAIFVAWPTAELDRVRADPERELLAVVDLVPELAERVRQGERAERMLGATQLPNFMRKPGGPGWALVGDAGCHKDPYEALGVCDAFRDAELLAVALDEILASGRPEAEALADYERLRNEATMVDYYPNIEEAKLGPPPPELAQMRAAARGNQNIVNRAFMVREGMLSPDALTQGAPAN